MAEVATRPRHNNGNGRWIFLLNNSTYYLQPPYSPTAVWHGLFQVIENRIEVIVFRIQVIENRTTINLTIAY